MRVGIQLPEVERDVRWPEYLAMAQAAEEVGFDSIWLGDHLIYDEPDRGPWEVWTMMAALAAATERVTIGPLVACAGFHPPGLIAKMAATIDEISQGRFVLGLGSGWNQREFSAFDIPYDRRVSRFEEAFRIIVGMLDGERVSQLGTYHSADEVLLLPKPHRRIPILIGSNGPRMLEHRRARTRRSGTPGGTTSATPPRGSTSSSRRSRPTSSAARACSCSSRVSPSSGRPKRACPFPKRGSPTRSGSWARPAPTR